MTTQPTTDDARTTLKQIFDEYGDKYRDKYEVIHESDTVIVIADHDKTELTNLSNATGVGYSDLLKMFRSRADDILDHKHTYDVFTGDADPLVFDKPENNE